MKLKDKVEYCLSNFPTTRECDVQLTMRIINCFRGDEMKLIDGKWFVAVSALKAVREDHVKRIRAKFNADGKYLPTNPDVIKKRRISEQAWHEEMSPSNPARG